MGLFDNIKNVFSRSETPDWDALEEGLIRGDIGIPMTTHLLEALQSRGRKLSAEDAVATCREEILAILPEALPDPEPKLGRPVVIMMVGVNGTGKTTTTAKLANLYQGYGHDVVLAAADTFRAAAIEQLEAWAGRLGCHIVKGQYQADPSSVCFDAYEATVARYAPFLICDTAGRLHTRHNLMEELKKLGRTLGKKDPEAPHERYLVVDATTGSNALNQAREFHKALDLTGVIVTKLDGSGKGGCVVSIQHELGIPTRYVGTGESMENFSSFDRFRFVNELL